MSDISAYYRNMVYDAAVDLTAAILANPSVDPSDTNIPKLAIEHAQALINGVKGIDITVTTESDLPIPTPGNGSQH